ncbi:3'-5' exonuclease [Streptomyces sp. NPDC053493]|uniref:3'-5' exonuclease n=1 Tax=Streptomyces sp. NPDC053493 TaxID=3365705 RepID=UPI0037CFB2A7
MSPGERANDYDATCAACGRPVPAGTGLLRHGPKAWEVYHPDHAPPPGPPPPGDHPGWHRRPLLSLDIATTGNRPAVDRVRAAALRGSDGTARDWILDPGSDIQYSNTGSDAGPGSSGAAPVLDEIAALVTAHLAAGELLVVWFAPYVLTTLHAELVRHGLAPLTERLPAGVAPVCDPLVLDRHADRYRPGSRSLRAVAEWYGVPHLRPGDPASDAEAALLLAQALGATHPSLAKLSRPMLHTDQILWHAEQTARHPGSLDWPFTPADPLPWEPPPSGRASG